MDERIQPPDQSHDDDRGGNSNLVLVVLFVVVVGIGVWLVSALLDARKIDDCISQGRRNCGERIDVPAR